MCLISAPYVVSVILNTNRRDDTLECLASLGRSTYERQRAIVLDNGSLDGSVEAVRSSFPGVRIVELAENLGYAGNNNVGITLALDGKADWILVLNEDTILAPECLEAMVVAGNSDRRIGIVGPLVYHFDTPELIQSAGGRLDCFWTASHIAQNEKDQGLFPDVRDVDWISGCCIMVRREVIQDVGPIDERFFYYWEETEWCIRARRAGWRIVHAPGAKLWHKGVQLNYKPSPSVTYYATRNRLLTLSKHRAPLYVRLIAWAGLVRTLASWTLRPKWKHLRKHRNALRRGLSDYLAGRWGEMLG